MAKICKTCGTENADNAIFCRECGSPFNQQVEEPVVQQTAPVVDAPVFEAPVEESPVEEAPAKKEENKVLAKVDELLAKVKLNRKTALIILGAVVGAIVLLSIILSLVFPGPKAVVNKLLKGIANEDAEAIISTVPSFVWEDEDEMEDAIDEFDDAFDVLDINKFTYEIKKISKLTEDEIASLEHKLDRIEEDNDEFDANKVTDYRKVKVKTTVKIDGEKETTISTLILVKYKGQWKVYDFGSVLDY